MNNRRSQAQPTYEYEYLGVSVAVSSLVRAKNTKDTTTKAKQLLQDIDKSPLKINQKIDAVKRFVIPSLDYALTEGTTLIKDLEGIDKEIRKIINNAIHANISPYYAESHWKDGGMSITPLTIRRTGLQVKALVELINNQPELFKTLSEKERLYRGINISDSSQFLNWEMKDNKVIQKRKGTSSRLGQVKLIVEKEKLNISYNNEGILGLKIDDKFISNPKEITQTLTKKHQKEAF